MLVHFYAKEMHRVSVVKLEGKRLLGIPRQRQEGSIKMNLKGTGCEGEDWIHLAQDMGQWQASLNMTMNLQIP
jgi:hypothetical protein